jgi:hypothetical protein
MPHLGQAHLLENVIVGILSHYIMTVFAKWLDLIWQ